MGNAQKKKRPPSRRARRLFVAGFRLKRLLNGAKGVRMQLE